MKPVVVFLFLYLCVSVESGIILDNLKAGISNTGQAVRCGAHKIGGFLTQRKNVECTQDKPAEEKTEASVKAETTNVNEINEKAQEKASESQTTAASTVVTVSQGRRVISVGANCPEGFRGDGKGNCREEY